MTLKSAIENATRTISTIMSGSTSEPEILDTLKQEHEEVAEMLNALVESETGAERRKLLARIKTALLPHIQGEQKVLYDALIAVRDKKIQQDGQEGYIEHELAALTLTKLEAISNPMSAEFAAAAKVLKELIEHHVQEEERNVWSDAKERFSPDQRVEMNRQYLAAKKLAVPVAKVAGPQPKKSIVAPANATAVAGRSKTAAVPGKPPATGKRRATTKRPRLKTDA